MYILWYSKWINLFKKYIGSTLVLSWQNRTHAYDQIISKTTKTFTKQIKMFQKRIELSLDQQRTRTLVRAHIHHATVTFHPPPPRSPTIIRHHDRIQQCYYYRIGPRRRPRRPTRTKLYRYYFNALFFRGNGGAAVKKRPPPHRSGSLILCKSNCAVYLWLLSL